jgi:hypothetical protein
MSRQANDLILAAIGGLPPGYSVTGCEIWDREYIVLTIFTGDRWVRITAEEIYANNLEGTDVYNESGKDLSGIGLHS